MNITVALTYSNTTTTAAAAFTTTTTLQDKAMLMGTGSSDPLVQLELTGGGVDEKKQSSTVKKRNLKPVWRERFTFGLCEPAKPTAVAEAVPVALEVVCFDHDSLGSNDFMGEVCTFARTCTALHRTAPHRTAPHRTAPHRIALKPHHGTAPGVHPHRFRRDERWGAGSRLVHIRREGQGARPR